MIISVVQRIEEEYPALIDSDLLHHKGGCYIVLGQYETALDVLKRADELEPDDPIILGNLGHAYVELGQYNDARRVFGKILVSDEDLSYSYLGLVRIVAATGEENNKIVYLKEAHDRATRENVSGNTLMSLWAELNKISASPDAAQKTLWWWSGRPAVHESTAQTGQPSAPAA